MNRLHKDPRIWFLTAMAVRLVLGIALWLLARTPDTLQSLRVLNSWLMCPDATLYHVEAQSILKLWQGLIAPSQLTLPPSYLGYPVILAGIYELVDSPLAGIVVNSLAFLISAVSAYHLALLMGRKPKTALVMAMCVALWPPSLAYSSTLAKDSFFIMGVFMLLFGLAGMLSDSTSGRSDWFLKCLVCLAGLYLMLNIRPSLSHIIAGFNFICILACTAGSIISRRFSLIWRQAGATAVVVLGIILAGNLSLVQLTLPSKIDSSQANIPIKEEFKPAMEPLRAGFLPSWREIEYELRVAERELWFLRQRYTNAVGISLSPHANIIPVGITARAAILAYGLQNLALRPMPWQAWPYRQDMLLARYLICLWSLLCYMALPGLFWGLWTNRRRAGPAGVVPALWVVILGLMVPMVVVNIGTLFRMRDFIVLPLLLFFSARPYGWLLELLHRIGWIKQRD